MINYIPQSNLGGSIMETVTSATLFTYFNYFYFYFFKSKSDFCCTQIGLTT